MTTNLQHYLEADAQAQLCISDEQAEFFLKNGFLVIRSVIVGEELKRLQDETQEIYLKGVAGTDVNEDYFYKTNENGQSRYWRTEYIIDKKDGAKSLLGNPFILRSVEKLQGNNFIPTWDSLVVKVPGNAASVPWHRDAAVPEGSTDPRPIFNVDFYLDAADEKSCLWVIPGSNHWDAERADQRCAGKGFDFTDAVPVPMNPGDVIFHNIQLLHGSPEGAGNALRRTIYYEFRPGEIEMLFGPHTLEYLPLKQQILFDCIARRQQESYAANEVAFEYRPRGAFAISRKIKPETYRYPFNDYWRKEI
jgi:phytanoyl-CoA hydroxylase